MALNWFALGLLALVAVCGCSGDADADAAAAPVQSDGAAASGTAGGASATAAKPSTLADRAEDSLMRAGEIEVQRETFTYGGGTRDPFNSLVADASTGPELSDLRLVGIYENVTEPSKSVVVLSEKVGGKRHKMRTGDRLGRIRLARIQPREAVFMIQDLGFERQETLSLRKQEDVTP